MYFFIKNSFSSLYLKVSPSEPLERWATMWPHSEHLVTIWNTSAVNWRRRLQEKRSLVLFMILGLVAIQIPSFMSTPRYGHHMWRGLSLVLESYSPLLSASLSSSLGGFEEERYPVLLSHGFEGHFILPQVSVTVTNSSECRALTSQALACRQQHIDATVWVLKWKENNTFEASQAFSTNSARVVGIKQWMWQVIITVEKDR